MEEHARKQGNEGGFEVAMAGKKVSKSRWHSAIDGCQHGLRAMSQREFVKKNDDVGEYQCVVDKRNAASWVFVFEGNEHVGRLVFGRVAKKGRDASGFACPIILAGRKG
jgi:hypothetical protein